MKKLLIAVAAMGLTSGIALADDSADTRAADHPCRKIEEACKAAGFVKGEAKEGKGLFKDCLGPIVKGTAVKGVTVDSSLPAACAAKEAEAKAAKANGKAPASAPAPSAAPAPATAPAPAPKKSP